jgi:hypothetical protein
MFAPTTDRVVVYIEEWQTTPNTPALGEVREWTRARGTWQPLFTPPVPGSFVEILDMSDTGVSIGVVWTGGISGSGTPYSWVHHPVTGVTISPPMSSGGNPTSISADGRTMTTDSSGASTMMVSRDGVLQTIPTPGCTTAIARTTSNDARVVSGLCGFSLGSIRDNGPFVSDVEFLQSLGFVLTPAQQEYSVLSVVSGDGRTYVGVLSERTPRSLCILKLTGPQCDPIDFNNDGFYPTDEDVIDFLTVLAGGACSNAPNCFDLDLNNDGLFPSDDDLIAFLRVLAGGECS